ncbi:hypothetical protein HYH03_018396 [Edaphochlamys debaryana]|uniref:Uncharacterized protein n=1 Tax=Edaphochlamys debaryana TaxID=47281 RepID=A0A835XKD9_9CHLO|nr:hypothetical protein HYH03_018396 [Edaphochlamys debaryana]|eukprot:KAG2482690.1 hypothetical protein HYH03_018396 [Edaphochlamys debaryana]
MPPKDPSRGGGAGGGAGPAGAAASACWGAGTSTSAGAAPDSRPYALPASFLDLYKALPAMADALLSAAAATQPSTGRGGSSAAGRGRGGAGGRIAALREGKERLHALRLALEQLPAAAAPKPKPQLAAAVAELLTAHGAETAALLRLLAAALRPGGEGEGVRGGGGGSGSAGSGSSGSSGGGGGGGSGGSGGTLSAFGRRMTVEAASATSAGGGGAASGRLATCLEAALLTVSHCLGVLLDVPPPTLTGALAAVRAALRATCAEECARALAESRLLEHASRVLLLLQARGPQGRSGAGGGSMAAQVLLTSALTLREAVEPGRSPCSPALTAANVKAALGTTSAAAAGHLRSVLRGRCLQTAVLVYGVSSLSLVDQGPCYGLPPPLHSAGLALQERSGGHLRQLHPMAVDLLLRLLASTTAPPLLGAEASLELALRVGRALGGRALEGNDYVETDAVAAGVSLRPLPVADWRGFALAALECSRALLMRQRQTSARLEQWREQWWRQVENHAADSFDWPDQQRMYERVWTLVADPILTVWPDGCLDLDALPPSPTPEVAAALKAGLLLRLSVLNDLTCEALLAACAKARPGNGSSFALFLAPLLAYGEERQAAWLVVSLGRELSGREDEDEDGEEEGERERGMLVPRGASGAGAPGPLSQAASSFLVATAEALQRCRRLGPPAAAAPAEPYEAAAAAEAAGASTSGGHLADAGPPAAAAPPLPQLRRMAALAQERWGPLLAAQGAEGGEAGSQSG